MTPAAAGSRAVEEDALHDAPSPTTPDPAEPGADDAVDADVEETEDADADAEDTESEDTESEDAESEVAESEVAESEVAESEVGETPAPAADSPPVSDNRRRAERTAPLFAELATLEKDDPRRERLREVLVEEHLPLVRHFARRFSNRGEPFDDLLQVGTLGLIAAIDRFDPTRGVEFLSFAVPTITGEIKRHFRDQGWSVRVPRRLQELHLSLNSAVGELAQKNGRAPTPSELAEHLGIPREEVLEGLAVANAYRSSSLDERLSGEDDSPTLAATLGEEDAALEGVEYRESLQPLLATIPARERRILILRFFGNMTQSQIAADIGISQMHVSRLLSQTLAKLREGLLKD
ncbi:SigB/SigF/SigG family RNA polymerase sigma factor [Geodermatophilus normandii]|uniref:SigB/SigF/SigG family RNA polymerase sigma factor n=1 Tax=Geodermatophilus normandii TaxID=1137989 RepID=A0A6P0GAG4_9ACTN|nr:SigB/SigF/SigG family RNA polymerase sigma factor [Geodermatophilus normandii]